MNTKIVDFKINNNSVFSIDPSGNLGVGVANPTQKIEASGIIVSKGTGSSYTAINGGDANGALFQLNRGGNANQNAYISQYQGSLFVKNLDSGDTIFTNTTGDVERFRIRSTGKIGINNSTPEFMIDVNSSDENFMRFTAPTTIGTKHKLSTVSSSVYGTSYYVLQNENGIDIASTIYSAELNGASAIGWEIQRPGSRTVTRRERALTLYPENTNGNVFEVKGALGGGSAGGIYLASQSGGSNESYGLIYHNTSSGSGAWYLAFSYGASWIGSISQSGTTGVAYNTTSDYRLKENVVSISDATLRLMNLKPSRFNFIADPDRTVDGFLAHEVQDIVPEAITGIKDEVDEKGNPKYQGIDQSKLVPLLTAALQEAITRIETLEQKVATLETA